MTTQTPQIEKITEFLYQEADLLDQNDLGSWIDLYTDEGTYWMPVERDQVDPLNHISIFYDDKPMMQIRKHNLIHKRAPSKEIEIRSSHLIGNVKIKSYDEKTGLCTVTSNFQAIVYYGEQTLFAGTYQHDLLIKNGGIQIQQKKVVLINCDASHGTIISYI